MLITCEGIDGSGKSTAARALAAGLKAAGHDVVETLEPTRSWLGEAVRRGFQERVSPWTEALLFMADHATHADHVRGLLEQGRIVVSDRWSDSTFAYQGAALGDVALLQRMEAPFDLTPDLTFLFDLDESVAMSRVARRVAAAAPSKMEEKFERADFLKQVRANYLRLARESPQRFLVLDASLPPEQVASQALAAARDRLASRQPR